MKEHKEARDELSDMLDDLDDRLGKITEDVKHTDQPLSQDFEEQATETENDQVFDQLGLSARSMITKIKRAITRIDKGGYGICVECGKQIPAERLQVLPYTDKCIDCAEEYEDD